MPIKKKTRKNRYNQRRYRKKYEQTGGIGGIATFLFGSLLGSLLVNKEVPVNRAPKEQRVGLSRFVFSGGWREHRDNIKKKLITHFYFCDEFYIGNIGDCDTDNSDNNSEICNLVKEFKEISDPGKCYFDPYTGLTYLFIPTLNDNIQTYKPNPNSIYEKAGELYAKINDHVKLKDFITKVNNVQDFFQHFVDYLEYKENLNLFRFTPNEKYKKIYYYFHPMLSHGVLLLLNPQDRPRTFNEIEEDEKNMVTVSLEILNDKQKIPDSTKQYKFSKTNTLNLIKEKLIDTLQLDKIAKNAKQKSIMASNYEDNINQDETLDKIIQKYKYKTDKNIGTKDRPIELKLELNCKTPVETSKKKSGTTSNQGSTLQKSSNKSTVEPTGKSGDKQTGIAASAATEEAAAKAKEEAEKKKAEEEAAAKKAAEEEAAAKAKEEAEKNIGATKTDGGFLKISKKKRRNVRIRSKTYKRKKYSKKRKSKRHRSSRRKKVRVGGRSNRIKKKQRKCKYKKRRKTRRQRKSKKY